eukprot:868062-Amphidinium_carterae.2
MHARQSRKGRARREVKDKFDPVKLQLDRVAHCQTLERHALRNVRLGYGQASIWRANDSMFRQVLWLRSARPRSNGHGFSMVICLST